MNIKEHGIYQYKDALPVQEKQAPYLLLREMAMRAVGELNVDLVKQLREQNPYLKEAEMHRQVPDHDIQHLDRAVGNGRKIVEKDFENDPRTRRIVEAALLLHDLITHPKNNVQEYEKEGAETAEYSENLLQACGYSDDEIQDILESIRHISYMQNGQLTTAYEKIAFDADKMDQFGAIGLMRYAATSGQLERPHFHPTDPLARTERELEHIGYTLDGRIGRTEEMLRRMRTVTGKTIALRRNDFERGVIFPEVEKEIEENKKYEPNVAWAEETGVMFVLNTLYQAGRELRSFYDPIDPFGENGRVLNPKQYPLDALILASREKPRADMPPEVEVRRREFLNAFLTELKMELAGQ